MTTDIDVLTIDQLVALIYGTRSRLADLQLLQRRRDPMPALGRLVAEAHRAVIDMDDALLQRVVSNPGEGWQVFDLIKATHDGSIQRLSQRLREVLPDRA